MSPSTLAWSQLENCDEQEKQAVEELFLLLKRDREISLAERYFLATYKVRLVGKEDLGIADAWEKKVSRKITRILEA